jgi:hypothetical protein
MSTDKDKTGGGSGDRPVLFGPPNDPALADRISKLTGPSLDTAMARLQAFSDDVFGEDEGEEDPDPFGSDETFAETKPPAPPKRPERTVPDPEDEAAADGLDRILETLSDEPETEPPPRAARSLFDVRREQETDEPVVAGPTSPIATVLARAGDAGATETDGDAYLDEPPYEPFVEPVGTGRGEELDETGYDPLDGMDDPAEELLFKDPDFPEDDLGFPDEDPLEAGGAYTRPDARSDRGDPDGDLWADDPLPPLGRGLRPEADAKGGSDHGSDRSYGLPEPSPYGDRDGMGGLFSYDDEERLTTSGTGEADQDDNDERPEGWVMPQTEKTAETRPPAPSRVADEDPVGAVSTGSALDGLITDLRWGGRGGETVVPTEPVAPDVADPTLPEGDEPAAPPPAARRSLIPSFLRRDAERAPEPDAAAQKMEVSPSPDPDVPGPKTGAEGSETVTMGPEGAGSVREQPERTRNGSRKRLLAGVALLGLLAATGAGAWLMSSGPEVRLRVTEKLVSPPVQTTGQADPVTALVGQPVPTGSGVATPPGALPDWSAPSTGSAATDGSTPLIPPGTNPAVDVIESAGAATPEPAAGPAEAPVPAFEPPLTADPAAQENQLAEAPALDAPPAGPDAQAPAPETPPPPEVSDLLAEIGRGAQPPVGAVSAEELAALQSRLSDMEAIARASEDRTVELSGELTGLTDQITALLQRDSDQAERLERMERLIRGQSAILSQFGQMEESLEQTQVVLLDVSARIGAVEGRNPADRDAVNRALADIESRLQALTANMSILARMSIEGVDALRAPNASAGSVSVQTAPPGPDQRTGGADPVFRTETGGFRISSDAAGRIPAGVKKDDFIDGYGYVLDVLPASDGQRLVVMENGSVLVPAAN